MKKLIKTINEITECGPNVSFSLEQIGFTNPFWRATIEVNYTDFFHKKDFDEAYVIDAIEERYIMREIAETPERAVKNISRRMHKVNKKFGYE